MKYFLLLPLLLLLGCALTVPVTIHGSLAVGDETLVEVSEDGEIVPQGELMDVYDIRVEAGDALSIRHEAEAFDCYLIYIDPSGTQVDNDDFGGAIHSQIDVTVEETGTAQVIVTSFYADKTGDYELTIFSP